MPRDNSMQPYLVRFKMADGEHISGALQARYTTDAEKATVEREITRAMKPATDQYPDGNPDIEIIEIRPVKDYMEIAKAAQALKDANPGRPMADDLGLDTPNRILHEPEITRNLAANQTPG